ncbi:MAG TPA: hypothetical protein PKV16_06085 [Caldisericia bacterium]|nr:hypothetical protein [Caldisericia bacterium]HPF49242.1 hypothetical protein [Caldisericia bacterium]HPI84078.1 hypothetical protein [Caldisericia bacterium]HPQ93336.1 hypothetical protein [Caldisericia bacterium]HRV75282.1 hypothetical protein [Caldisericia bacterium]
MFHFNVWYNTIWFILAVGLTYAAAFLASLVSGEDMPNSAKGYCAIFTALLPNLFHMIFKLGFVWVILANIVLFFILPFWWQPEDENRKLFVYGIFVLFNIILGLAAWLVVDIVKLGF